MVELRRRPRRPWLWRPRAEPPPDPGILVAPKGRRGDRTRKRERTRFRARTWLSRLRLPLVTRPPTVTCLHLSDEPGTPLGVTDSAKTALTLADELKTTIDTDTLAC